MIELSNGAMNMLRRHTARLTHVWQLNRPDGQEPLQFTTHDQLLNTLDAVIFDPRPGITMSANRRSAGIGEKSTEISGLIGEDGITYQDLHQGRLWGAMVMQYMHDWSFDFGPPLMTNKWFISEIQYDDRTWTFQLTGLSGRLKGKRGEVFSRLCQNELGTINTLSASTILTLSACPVDVNVYPLKVAGAAVIDKTTTHGLDPSLTTIYLQKTGSVNGFANTAHRDGDFAAAYFQHGRVVFQSGVLQGMQEAVYTDINIGDTARAAGVRAFKFVRSLPDIPAVGDTVDCFVGCDKNWQTCRDKFDALQGNVSGGNPIGTSGGFRGFPEIPGTDRATTYPPARGQ